MLWMAIVPLTSSALLTVFIYQNEYLLHSLTELQWLLLFCVSAITMALAITPTTYVALVSGYFIGFWGIIPLVIAYQIASIIGYLLAKKLDKGIINDIVSKYPKAQSIVQNVEKSQLSLTILSRLSPALPFALMNVILSSAQISLRHFFWGGLFGMLPRSIFFIWLGIEASKLSEALNNQSSIYITVFISSVVMYMIYRVLKVK